MFKFLKKKPKIEIEIGQTWIESRKDGNPFVEDVDIYTVEDYRNGWVKISWPYCGIKCYGSRKEESFRYTHTLKG